jgi:hypothetical protein
MDTMPATKEQTMRAAAVTVTGVLLTGLLAGMPAASAAIDGPVVRVQDGAVRCMISDADASHVRSQVVCGHADGTPFGASPMSTGKFPEKLSLTVVLDTGERYWQAGTIPGDPGADVVLGAGQTHHAGGWSITAQQQRTVVRNDVTGRGMIVNDVGVYQV